MIIEGSNVESPPAKKPNFRYFSYSTFRIRLGEGYFRLIVFQRSKVRHWGLWYSDFQTSGLVIQVFGFGILPSNHQTTTLTYSEDCKEEINQVMASVIDSFFCTTSLITTSHPSFAISASL